MKWSAILRASALAQPSSMEQGSAVGNDLRAESAWCHRHVMPENTWRAVSWHHYSLRIRMAVLQQANSRPLGKLRGEVFVRTAAGTVVVTGLRFWPCLGTEAQAFEAIILGESVGQSLSRQFEVAQARNRSCTRSQSLLAAQS